MHCSNQSRAIYTHILYIVLLGLAGYANTLSNGFVFDDSAYISSSTVRDLSIPNMFLKDWLGLAIYRPLTLLSLGIDFHFFVENPAGYHFTNLILHIINGILLYFLARRLQNHPLTGLWAALFYIIHPIQTEVVAWISARGDLIATLFFLTSYLAYLRTQSKPESFGWRSVSWGLYAGSILAKETAIVLPAILFLHMLYFDKSRLSFRHFTIIWFKQYYGYGVVLVSVLILRWLILNDAEAPSNPISTNFLAPLSLIHRLSTIVAILTHYLLLLTMPWHLSADYSYASIPPVTSFFDPWFFTGLISLTILIWIHQRTMMPWLKFIIPSLGICLLPVSNLFFLAPSGMAERYLHLSMVPLSLMLGFVIQHIVASQAVKPRNITIILLTILCCFSAGTILRNRIWHSDYTLFKAVLNYYPTNARAHENLGYAYYQKKDFHAALHHFHQATLIQPTRLKPHLNLGSLYNQLKNYNQAIQIFKNAISYHPDNPELYFNLGLNYQRTKKYQQAIRHYRTALQLNPRHQKSMYNLGRAYEYTAQNDAAIKQYTTLISLNPNAIKAYYRLGQVYYTQSRFKQMSDVWSTLIDRAPHHQDADRIRQLLHSLSKSL